MAIDNVNEAYKVIVSSGNNGTFLPVLGFQLSCNTAYNFIPEECKPKFSCKLLGEQSVQISEFEKPYKRIRAVELNLKNTYLKENEDTYLGKAYIEQFLNLVRLGEHTNTISKEETCQFEDIDWLLIALLTHITELGFLITKSWSEAIGSHPVPLGPSFKSPRPGIGGSSAPYTSIQRSLNCCAILLELDKTKKKKINSLYIERIYSKLLRFASEICDQDKLWGKNPCNSCQISVKNLCTASMKNRSLKDIHSKFIINHPDQTNWTKEFSPKSTTKRLGVRLSHILWLEKLISHILMAGTRAYRTHEELAFLLSLDDDVNILPDETSDPFEMGLILKSAIRDTETLKTVLRYCEDEKNRPPQPFYWALSTFLKDIWELEDNRNRNLQIIQSLCLDREMERALAYIFPSFWVLYPVFINNKNKELCPEWILAECVRQKESGIGYVVKKWYQINGTETDALLSNRQEGPLIIKLFGSPLESLPKKANDVYHLKTSYLDKESNVSHRVVLDENDLLNTLNTDIPAKAVQNIESVLTSSQYFFFGQNAIRWSDRLPYFKIPPREHNHNINNIAFGHSGVLGSTALTKHTISYIDTNKVKPEDVIINFIKEVANKDAQG